MNVEIVAKACERCFDLNSLELSHSYYYNSLAFCVIDAVFSIGVRYTSTVNTVKNFCRNNMLTIYKCQETYDCYSIDELVDDIERCGVEGAATILFNNHQRTSTRNGILKSDAVLRFAHVLQENGIHTFSDYQNIKLSKEAEQKILSIPGQHSGLSLHYFYMLAGSGDDCKPDRHVLRFLENYLGMKVTVDDARTILTQTAAALNIKYPNVTTRALDYAIWNHMSLRKPLPVVPNSIRYNKLVRDRIPEIIEASGKTCSTEILTDEAYLKMLDKKLDEELVEYHKDQNIEELVDLLEVIRACAIARGYSVEELERVRVQKTEKRGGFEKKILLKDVTENGNA